MNRAPLELAAQVVTADGRRYRWDPNNAPGDRLRNFSFSTKTGEGFSAAQGQLARRIDLDYPDLNLVDHVSIYGMDGTVAWEGRVSALPRELSDSHSIGVTLTGWMSHAKDKKFSEVYVDRDLNAWEAMSAARRANRLTNNFTFLDGPNQSSDPSTNLAQLSTGFTGAWASPYKPYVEAWYDAGPDARIGKITYSWKREGAVTLPDANWFWQVGLSTDDIQTTTQFTANLSAAGPVSNQTLTANASSYRWAVLVFLYNLTPAGSNGIPFGIAWSKLAVYGTHGLTTVAGEVGEPEGVYASDVISDIAARWCPQFDTSGVQQTSYVIQHLAFKDRVYPYDAFLDINKYHLWNLAVWEDRGYGPRLTFQPYDLTDYDWEIRTDDPGTTFSPQGPGVDDLFNGVVVTYTDALSGKKVVLSPNSFPTDLADSSPDNPWNAHGIDHWDEIQLSTPTIQAQALQLGRAALADRNTPKTPGTITVSGYIRDRQGNEQPVWKVRAGDTISVTNFPNDTPRLIVETNYDHEQKQLTMSIDRPFALLDAYIDRMGTALSARGLS